jgi:hypothetical protein
VVCVQGSYVTSSVTAAATIVDDCAVGTVTTFTGLGSATTTVQSFVAKFNSNGVIQWVKEFISGASESTAVSTDALATDTDGNVYLTGNFASTIVFRCRNTPTWIRR